MASLCRDCCLVADTMPSRCSRCGGGRLVHHRALACLTIAHIDCDAFYASVEKRDRPELHARPVIVGGGTRGVVTAACYIARIYGVKSAMPMFKALKACPDAVVIKPDLSKYIAASRQVRALMSEMTPLVQPLSIDEAVVDLSGTQALHGAPPAAVLARFAGAVEKQVGVTVSIGLAANPADGEDRRRQGQAEGLHRDRRGRSSVGVGSGIRALAARRRRRIGTKTGNARDHALGTVAGAAGTRGGTATRRRRSVPGAARAEKTHALSIPRGRQSRSAPKRLSIATYPP
jgi:hypothetical protein